MRQEEAFSKTTDAYRLFLTELGEFVLVSSDF